MQSHREQLSIDTRGHGEIIDVTDEARKAVANSGLQDGFCLVFVAHSTCAVTTMEHEPGCDADLDRILDELAPMDARWEHNERNADTNGHSHAKAAILGPSVTLPFAEGEIDLGTWQRVVCIDFDDRPRTRRLVVSVLGI